MDNDTLFQQSITKRQFMSDLEMAKRVVDCGFRGHFILLNNTSFRNVRTIGGTTLADIKECYGGYPIYKDYRFALPHESFDDDGNVVASSIKIRDITKKDKAELRQSYRFFPAKTYIAELVDADGFALLIPFKQGEDGAITMLSQSNIYRQNRASGRTLQEGTKIINETIWQNAQRIIELFPDLMDSLLAVVRYRDVDMCIPIEKDSAKKTFRSREKAGERRAHLIHNVNPYDRKNLKNVDKVESHLRGKSDFVMEGEDISLIATPEWSLRYGERQGRIPKMVINA